MESWVESRRTQSERRKERKKDGSRLGKMKALMFELIDATLSVEIPSREMRDEAKVAMILCSTTRSSLSLLYDL